MDDEDEFLRILSEISVELKGIKYELTDIKKSLRKL